MGYDAGLSSRDPSERLDAGRNRYDNRVWRRIYDNFAWRWIVGPAAYGGLGAALLSFWSGTSFAGGLPFGVGTTLFAIFSERRADRQQQAATT